MCGSSVERTLNSIISFVPILGASKAEYPVLFTIRLDYF